MDDSEEVSDCCHGPVRVTGALTQYTVCTICNCPCDTLTLEDLRKSFDAWRGKRPGGGYRYDLDAWDHETSVLWECWKAASKEAIARKRDPQ